MRVDFRGIKMERTGGQRCTNECTEIVTHIHIDTLVWTQLLSLFQSLSEFHHQLGDIIPHREMEILGRKVCCLPEGHAKVFGPIRNNPLNKRESARLHLSNHLDPL